MLTIQRHRGLLEMLIILQVCTGCAANQARGDAITGSIESQIEQVREDEIRNWITTFASNTFNGRAAGTKDGIAAGEWLADHLRAVGIQPSGDNGTYLQCFDKGYNEFHELGSLTLHDPKGKTAKTKTYRFPEQFFPGLNTGRGEITAEVVYVGHGISAPGLGYDDYDGIDVRGKIVLLNRDAPVKDATVPSFVPWAHWCKHRTKIETAARHGAAGLLYANQTYANSNITHIPGFLVAGIGKEPLADLLANTGRTNKKILERIAATQKPHSFPTGKTVTMKANTTWHPDGKACNVIGFIEGTDPKVKDEVILIGAHYDGLGNCSVVLPGALDNASGAIDVLAVARAIAQSGAPLRRTIAFLFFSGEETGMDGSYHYLKHPKFPKNKAVCYINLDTVGNGEGFLIQGSEGHQRITRFFSKANKKYVKKSFQTTPIKPNYGRARGDGQAFLRAGYPLLEMRIAKPNKPTNWHLPSDKVELTVDIRTMADVVKLLIASLTHLAQADSI